MFEITIDGLNMVENERKTTQSGNVRELSFLVSICLSRTLENSKCFLHSPRFQDSEGGLYICNYKGFVRGAIPGLHQYKVDKKPSALHVPLVMFSLFILNSRKQKPGSS